MPKRLKRLLKWTLLSACLLVLSGWLSLSWLLKRWTAQPPPLPSDTTILEIKPETRGNKVWIGGSWAGYRDGLPVVYLKGSPFELGYAHGVLLKQKMHTLENEFMDMIREWVPQDWKIQLLKNYVIYRNRHLSEHVPLQYRLEVFGTTLGCPDIHPHEGSFYNRMLNYHAAHDVSYMMIDNPLVSRAGCTSFGAWGGATVNGHLLAGRNFDWEAAEVFSRDRVVILCEPDDGIPFISVSWAGMAGVVTGMNRAGISVTLNGAPSRLPTETATPAAIVAREILQNASDLGQAIQILRNAKVFVSTLWLVGSRADGKFVVIEKTPETIGVREPDGDSIVCANHFQTPGLRDDPRNQSYMAESTSRSRAERLSELLRQEHGKIDAGASAGFLRDFKLPGGGFPGYGHRGSLNALIATHATVMDLTDGIFWAAKPPHQLGAFVAFDVNDFSRELPERALATDPAVATGGFENARRAADCLAKGRRALDGKDAAAALELAESAELLNPGLYQNALLRGRALLKLERPREAAQAFEAALAGRPAFLEEQRTIEQLLRQAHNAISATH
jgi:hypothetical protein